MASIEQTVRTVLETTPSRYRGPGGAIAVLKDGELVGEQVWGYADLERRIPLETKTQLPICSISKQFVCALLIDLERNPTPAMAVKGDVKKQWADQLAQLLPPEVTKNSGLTIQHLCDMRSGIRDYWAMTTLWGAGPEDEFLIENACGPALERTKSFHFQPGTEYSYSNVNFHVLGRLIERVSEEPLGKLLADRIFTPAGMTTAFLCPNTAKHPPPCVGYEGDEQRGFLPAVNRMEWAGDAGIVASLADMVAYEKYLDRLSSDPGSWYKISTERQKFSDGTPARYHYGLARADIDGVDTIGHGGALRGYRLQRVHAPQERLSIVAMFNHEADASGSTEYILRGIINKPARSTSIVPTPDWFGTFLDKGTDLAVTVSKGNAGEVRINYAGSPAPVKLVDPSRAQSRDMTAEIDGNSLHILRIADNRELDALRIVPRESGSKDPSLVGVYRCEEVDSTFHCSGKDGLLYGAFDGYLGRGPLRPMRYLGGDVWALSCPRGLDAPAPGDWTVVFRRDKDGFVAGFQIGCWLARGLEFVKT